ncbi:MAG: phosphomethylpyrimidine synthase ThiC [Candidatus Coatesbacteria bacterium]|nr:phosphomethylpyrimidine synthase ThiC [Candidatus Coatesbacteria bacterium]
MTQISEARIGHATPEVLQVAQDEGLDPEVIRGRVASGHIVIPCNRVRKHRRLCGIGKGLTTKVNANLGTSTDRVDLNLEIEKAKLAVQAGADTVMDLSTGGDLRAIRKSISDSSDVIMGTVPIYDAAVRSALSKKGVVRMTTDDMFDAIESHCADGVDFITVHCGVTWDVVQTMKSQGRLTDIVSRGGAFLASWMLFNEQENPLYEQYDRLLSIARKYDVCLSLGDGLRPGSLADSTDRGQIAELLKIGELQKRGLEAEVQCMVEGPGHIPISEIEANVVFEKKLCNGAPFYVLGPLVTDIAPGWDHIVCAIGGAIAAAAGADYLCYVTPSEHLALPTLADVRAGVIAAKIAAHAADIAKGIPTAINRDREMARARHDLDWKKQMETSLDPTRFDEIRASSKPREEDVCTMCGEYCAIKGLRPFLRKDGD